MPFPEPVKLEVKKKSHFSCCLCHALGVEVHHIIPEYEDGPDTEDNAAPLCPSCHETYGDNKQKRKFVREARDFWYELCEKRYKSDGDRLDEILKIVQGAASKHDIDKTLDRVLGLEQLLSKSFSISAERDRYIEQVDRMQQRVMMIQNELEKRLLTLAQLQKKEAVTQVGVQIAVEMASARKEALQQSATEAYGHAVGLLMKISGMSLEDFMKIFQDAFHKGSLPENEFQQLLYNVSLLYKCSIQFATSIGISSSVVPVLLEEFDVSPDRPIGEIQERLAVRIRAGDLDKD